MKLIIVGEICNHNTLHFNPGPYTEQQARQRASEIIKEFDEHGGNNTATPGSFTGPPNPCGPHKIIELE